MDTAPVPTPPWPRGEGRRMGEGGLQPSSSSGSFFGTDEVSVIQSACTRSKIVCHGTGCAQAASDPCRNQSSETSNLIAANFLLLLLLPSVLASSSPLLLLILCLRSRFGSGHTGSGAAKVWEAPARAAFAMGGAPAAPHAERERRRRGWRRWFLWGALAYGLTCALLWRAGRPRPPTSRFFSQRRPPEVRRPSPRLALHPGPIFDGPGAR